jgi:hypothetical protein
MYQGTTSVVPQTPQNKGWALAPEEEPEEVNGSKQALLNGEKIVNLDARNLAWKRTRESGQTAYVIRDVLIAGVSVCVFDVGYNAYSHHLPLGKVFLASIIPILFSVFGGFIGGILGWNSNESRYQKALAQDSSTNEILIGMF